LSKTNALNGTELAAELVALQPAVIIAGSAPGAVAARDATRAIPIAMASVQNPMALGLAASMARPGGNVTGFWAEGYDSLIGKRLELFKDAVPGASGLAVFVDPTDASDVSTVKALPAAARYSKREPARHNVRIKFEIVKAWLDEAVKDILSPLEIDEFPFLDVARDLQKIVLPSVRKRSVENGRSSRTASIARPKHSRMVCKLRPASRNALTKGSSMRSRKLTSRADFCATLTILRRQILTTTGASVTALSTVFIACQQLVCCNECRTWPLLLFS
jgi:ABC transporter substrate binding protein